MTQLYASFADSELVLQAQAPALIQPDVYAGRDRIKVAVVGGGVGRLHLGAYRSLAPLFDVVAICDIDEERARALAAAYAVPNVATDIGQVCAMDDVDVVDICTPPSQHFSMAQQVLAAGKHAVCEKPLVASVKEVDDLLAAERQAGKRVMPIFQYRFGGGIQKLKALVEQGIAGRAYLATVETAWRRRPEYYAVPWRGKWQTELGGALVSQAIHAHDLFSYIAGPVRSVFARTATRVNAIEVEDCAAVSLEMADGSLASLSVTLGSAVEITRHRFCYANLTAESNTQPYRNACDPWTFSADSSQAAARIEDMLACFVPLPEGYAGQFYRFYVALTRGTELPVTLADARASLELISAVYHSSRTGRPVELPVGTGHPLYAGWLP